MAGLVNIDVGGAASGLFGLIDNLFTSDAERAEAKRSIMEIIAKVQLGQIAVNEREAQSENWFVAGWRPAIGWAGAATIWWAFLVYPFMQFIAWALAAYSNITLPLDTLPKLDLTELMPVILGMLGLGGMRTYEKLKGVNKNR